MSSSGQINNFMTIQSFYKPFLVFFFTMLSILSVAQTTLDTAVNFTVKDVTGTTHRLNEYLEQGKMVVIDFFTTTCGPCVTYAPEINASYEHFGCNTSTVVFLGINWGADNAGVIDFSNSYGVHYPGISGTEGNGNHVVSDYNVLSYPTVILILPNGAVVNQYIWPPSTQFIDSVLVANGAFVSVCNTTVQTPVYVCSGVAAINSVYPNPATTEINFTTSLRSNARAEIRNLLGVTVVGLTTVYSGITNSIDIKMLAPGPYYLMLRDEEGNIVDRKIILKTE